MKRKLLKTRMNKDTLSTVVNTGIASILSALAKVIDDRVMPAVEDGEDLKTVLKRVISELQSEFKPAQPSTTSASNKVETKTTTTKAKSSAKDVLKDANGNAIPCDGVKKTDNTKCAYGAKHTHEGKHYCGTHIKGAQGTKPKTEKKPTFSNKQGVVATSSVNDILSEMDEDIDI
jgi:hypothetical protein